MVHDPIAAARPRFRDGVTDEMIAATLYTIPATHNYRDAVAAAALVRGTDGHPAVIRAILDRRADWLDWLTVTQTKWQRHSRRLSHARTGYWANGSVEYRPDPSRIVTRERYVRCHDGEEQN